MTISNALLREGKYTAIYKLASQERNRPSAILTVFLNKSSLWSVLENSTVIVTILGVGGKPMKKVVVIPNKIGIDTLNVRGRLIPTVI